MAINISASVGEGGKNLAADLIQIDNQLRKVGMLATGPVTPQSRVAAIKKFQEIWGIRTAGKPDGKIDPGGMTLRRLNETATPLKLNAISIGTIAYGGYGISFTVPAPPKPYQLFLGPSTVAGDYLEVTAANPKDMLTAKNQLDLLKLIQKRNAWGQTLAVKLFVVLDGTVISESTPQNLPCPVQPHTGKMLPLDETNNGPKLTYQGDSEQGPFYGRMFHKIVGFDGYFFKYGGQFETNNVHRGFDCITYAGCPGDEHGGRNGPRSRSWGNQVHARKACTASPASERRGNTAKNRSCRCVRGCYPRSRHNQGRSGKHRAAERQGFLCQEHRRLLPALERRACGSGCQRHGA